MKQCERGHFFDDVRYQECPYCEKVQPTYGSTISVSQVIEEPAAVAVAEEVPVETPELESAAASASEPPAPEAPEAPAPEASAPETATPEAPAAEPEPEPEPTPAPIFAAPAPASAVTVSPLSAAQAASVNNAAPTPKTTPQEYGSTVGVFSSQVGIDPPVAFAIVIAGPDKGASFTLQAGRSFIGRSAGSDIELTNDEAVSREGHALISYDARKNSFLVASGQGRQITYLNGEELVDPKPIKAYDVVEVGRSKISFLPFCGEEFSW
jgi:hypothetical protein